MIAEPGAFIIAGFLVFLVVINIVLLIAGFLYGLVGGLFFGIPKIKESIIPASLLGGLVFNIPLFVTLGGFSGAIISAMPIYLIASVISIPIGMIGIGIGVLLRHLIYITVGKG